MPHKYYVVYSFPLKSRDLKISILTPLPVNSVILILDGLVLFLQFPLLLTAIFTALIWDIILDAITNVLHLFRLALCSNTICQFVKIFMAYWEVCVFFSSWVGYFTWSIPWIFTEVSFHWLFNFPNISVLFSLVIFSCC